MSDARFWVEPPERGASILNDVYGHAFTPQLPGSGNRVVMILNDEDYAKVGEEGPYTVTDQMTGIEHEIIRADCGAGCRCGAEISG